MNVEARSKAIPLPKAKAAPGNDSKPKPKVKAKAKAKAEATSPKALQNRRQSVRQSRHGHGKAMLLGTACGPWLIL